VTIRTLCWWAAWWVAGVVCGAPYVEERTGLIFPDDCGGWVRTGEHVYEEKELGISVSYTNHQQKTLTAYAYRGGVEDIPTGGDSELMLNLTTQTAEELKQVWKERGGEVEEILPSAVIREEPSGRGLATIVAHRIVLNGQVLITISGLTGYRDTILKVRYTYARSPLDEGIADLKRFVVGLLLANREGLDEHFAGIAEQFSAETAVPSREAVLRAMAVLEDDVLSAEAPGAAKDVIRFVEMSEDVLVTLGEESAPWVMEIDERDEQAQGMSALLLAVYLGGNARAQLETGEPRNQVFAGWKAALKAYRQMRDAGKRAFRSLDELAAAERNGELERRAREVQRLLDEANRE
jgi:hypothetical protein